MPRDFFNNHLKPNYRDWLNLPLDERLAKNAVSDANNMAARIFNFWNANDISKIGDVLDEGAYRNYLSSKCPDFGLVRDIADAHKHVELNRSTRRVTRSDQTQSGTMGWGEGGFGEGRFGGVEQLVITLDDGSKRPLTAVMGNVINMWEQLLSDWNI